MITTSNHLWTVFELLLEMSSAKTCLVFNLQKSSKSPYDHLVLRHFRLKTQYTLENLTFEEMHFQGMPFSTNFTIAS